MKINIKNIVSEYPRINQSILPDALKKIEFDFVSENLDLYNDDADIKKYIDTFVLKLNEVTEKSPKKKKPVASKKTTPKKANDLKSKIQEINDKKTSDKGSSPKSNNNILVVKPAHGKVSKIKNKPNSLASFKRYLKENIGYTFDVIVNRGLTKTKNEKGTRRIELVQTDSIMYVDEKGNEAWLNYEKAANWEFANEYVKYSDGDFSIKFLYDNKMQSKVKTNKKRGSSPKKKEDKFKKVGSVDLQVTFIKSFISMQGKKVTKKRILNLYKRIEKAATELKIRKTSKHSKEVMFVADSLKAVYNSVKGNLDKLININMPDEDYNKLYEIAFSEKQRTSVALIKRYVGMFGLEWNEKTKKRAENLLKAIKRALSIRTVKNDDMYFDKIKEIQANIEGYLLQNNELFPQGIDLKGLSGLVGISIPKKKSIVDKKRNNKKKKKISVNDLGLQKISNKQKNNKLGEITLMSAYDISQIEEQDIECFKIENNVGDFLGKLEKKPKHSIAVTLDAEQGAGKTRAFFQFADALAKKGNTVLFVSMEEHPGSSLFKSKQEQYISKSSLHNFYPIGEIAGYDELATIINQFDVVMIDSWNKIKQISPHVDFDRDLRKAYDGKLFFIIFQRTQDGKMRGGSQAQFDGDIILKVKKQSDFKNNYIYADKNRYQDKDLSLLLYNIYNQKLIDKTHEKSKVRKKAKK